ncbi:MAG TPA: hypothetical protein VHQ01_02915 [Pyrinomonadaceae bacterium]|nr:hypothetical protein [Pyrinomonadaceae bacterium]
MGPQNIRLGRTFRRLFRRSPVNELASIRPILVAEIADVSEAYFADWITLNHHNHEFG